MPGNQSYQSMRCCLVNVMMRNFHFLAVLTMLLDGCFVLGSKRLKIMLETILHLLCCNRNPSLLVKEHEERIQLKDFPFLPFYLFVPIINCLNISYISYFDINYENFISFPNCFKVSFLY